MDSSRPHIIDFANQQSHQNNSTIANLQIADANHNEKNEQDVVSTKPVPQLESLFAAHASRLQVIQNACSAAQGAVADLELILTGLSARPGEPIRQVRSLFNSHDMNLEAVRIACECAQEGSVELMQGLEELFACDGC